MNLTPFEWDPPYQVRVSETREEERATTAEPSLFPLLEPTRQVLRATAAAAPRSTPLPVDFQPAPYSVIIGRGNKNATAVGNRRLHVLVTSFLPAYSASKAGNKIEKSLIVSRVVDIIRECCPIGAFIKLEKGRWWNADDRASREKVGYVFRDLLHDKYRSSSRSKVTQRKREKTHQENPKQAQEVCNSREPQTCTATSDCQNPQQSSNNASSVDKGEIISEEELMSIFD
jgi:hypothetical protein